MGSQIEDLVSSLKSLHISRQVRWASDVVDNDGKTRMLKEIRGLERIKELQRREHNNLQHLLYKIKKEHKNSNLTTMPAISDINSRLKDLTAKEAACEDHINMRRLSLEFAANPPSLQI
jgi:hypothetical protein